MTRIALVALVLAACGSRNAFECMTNNQCVLGGKSGVCVQNACAFPDSTCPEGYKFESNAPGGVGGTCATGLVDAGSAACGALGQGCCATAPACGDGECTAGTCTACSAQVALGRRFTCVLRGDGTIWCAGDNSLGQLGLGIAGVPSATRIQVRASDTTLIADATAISAGREHACAIRAGGTVWCWGANYSGQCGNATSAQAPAAVQVVQTGGAPLTNIVEIEAGYTSTCARDSGGAVWCWGDGSKGQLGDNLGTQRTTAARVLATAGTSPLAGVTELVMGTSTACAFASNVVCWGANDQGEFGDGTLANHLRPVAVPTTTSIGVGMSHMCRLNADSSVTCAGWAAHARLGGTTVGFWDSTKHSTPIDVLAADGSKFTGAQSIAAGALSCAIMTDKTVMCWGDNVHGQSGNGAGSFAPQKVTFPDGSPLTDVDQLVVKFAHTCAHRTTGEWLCWGRNSQGELGDGTFVNRGFPTALKGACP